MKISQKEEINHQFADYRAKIKENKKSGYIYQDLAKVQKQLLNMT